MKVLLLLSALTLLGSAFAAEPIRGLKYDTKHERNALDFCPAKGSAKPSSVYIELHGEGFRNGDKSQLDSAKQSPSKMQMRVPRPASITVLPWGKSDGRRTFVLDLYTSYPSQGLTLLI